MLHNLLFIEGLPGSGKTTFARKLKEYYISQGVEVVSISEGELHPLDLAWCSYCKEEEYHSLIQRYPEIKEEIEKNTVYENGFYITAYTQVKHKAVDKHFFDDFEKYEVYQLKSKEDFLNLHLNRWKAFAKEYDPNKLYIFECVFLQNHINQLILEYDASLEDMHLYFKGLINPLSIFNPFIIYIEQKNVEKTLNQIIEKRVSVDPTKYRDWIENVEIYLESTKFGKDRGYLGAKGFLKFEKYRLNCELEILKKLKCSSVLIPLKDSYDLVFENIKRLDVL